MLRTLALLAALFALAFHTPAQAYGRYAHGAVARIALANASPATRAKVAAMLRQTALLQTPSCRAASPEDASVWPDCIRAMGERFSYTSPWHYQNIDICKPFDPASACKDGNCVSAQIDRQVKILQNSTIPQSEKVAALAFLIHFVGDLHMPLHAGDRGDRGGNDVKSSYGDYVSERLNLHSVWDGQLAERALTTPPSLERVYSAEERAELAAGTTEDWSREAWGASHDVAYALALGGDPCGPKPEGRVTLTNAAIEQAIAPARLQVERAGLRLARLLDEALDPTKAFTPERRR
ncbi:S1/P1 nuclease [Sphingomonas qomolangmaensis]|uniref:S1/P1 nuclease n=1 Tax=Sphingomonas qomolangmaensis TaxID=2918765 RepID=A0ABY5L4Q1_9SPHN|nr:S1/P1 nuclease [Sphingomonas qomolangmaensis]UUL81777.1 S1/P1 nuclease [Sphingomonas qomolangmaensis]